MRCNICDSDLSNPTWNRQLKTFEPCSTCLDVIFSVFEDYPVQEEEKKELDNSEETDILPLRYDGGNTPLSS